MKNIFFMPYVKKDGIPTFCNSEIANMYHRAFDEGWGFQMFHDGSIRNVAHFVEYITGPGVMFWGVYYKAELMGFFYVNRIERTNAHLHFAFFKKWWGTTESIQAGRQALQLLLATEYDGKTMFELILGVYPSWNKHVLAYVHRFGAHTVTEIPHLIWSEKKGKSVEGTIVSVTREDLECELIPE